MQYRRLAFISQRYARPVPGIPPISSLQCPPHYFFAAECSPLRPQVRPEAVHRARRFRPAYDYSGLPFNPVWQIPTTYWANSPSDHPANRVRRPPGYLCGTPRADQRHFSKLGEMVPSCARGWRQQVMVVPPIHRERVSYRPW